MERAAPPAPKAAIRPASLARPVAQRPTTSFARILGKLAGFHAAPPKPALHAPSAPPGSTQLSHVVHARHHEPHDGRGESDAKDDPHALQAGEGGEANWEHRAALLAPPQRDGQIEARGHVEGTLRHASVETLAPTLLRKMAWSGDGKRGAARLELGDGALSGAVVTLEADGREVALSVEGLTAGEEASLRTRLAEGLSARGFRLVG